MDEALEVGALGGDLGDRERAGFQDGDHAIDDLAHRLRFIRLAGGFINDPIANDVGHVVKRLVQVVDELARCLMGL